MKKLFDRRMVGFILAELLMAALAESISDPIQKAAVVTMFFNISLAMFGVLVGGNVIEKVKAKVADEPKV